MRSRCALKLAMAGCAALAAGIAAQADDPLDLDWIDREALQAGEILLHTNGERRFRGHVEAAVLIAATAQAVWAVLEDCESAPEYVPHVESCEPAGWLDGGRSQLFRQEVKFTWFLPRFEHVFRLDYDPYRRIDVHKVSGPLERMEGSWQLVREGDASTLLLYTLDLDPGLLVPNFVVAATLRRDLPRILAAVRERAQALD